MDYSNFVVANSPETILYIPNFITSEEEQHILNSVKNAPKPKWTQLTRRRLLNYGGIPHKNGMICEEIPKWLQIYIDKINNLGVFDSQKANHVLVNEYLSGQGIMAHKDGPLFYPTISTISCGSHTILEFYKSINTIDYSKVLSNNEDDDNIDDESIKANNLKPQLKILIEPRSLLILKNDLYHKYMHSISEIHEDIIDDTVLNLKNCENSYKIGDKIIRDKRISLTIRHVPKTSKMKLQFGLK